MAAINNVHPRLFSYFHDYWDKVGKERRFPFQMPALTSLVTAALIVAYLSGGIGLQVLVLWLALVQLSQTHANRTSLQDALAMLGGLADDLTKAEKRLEGLENQPRILS